MGDSVNPSSDPFFWNETQIIERLTNSESVHRIRANCCFDASRYRDCVSGESQDKEHLTSIYDELKQQWKILVSVTAQLIKKDFTLNNNSSSSSSSSDSSDGAWSSDWFDQVYNQHIEEGRYYHTSMHLKELFDLCNIIIDHSALTSEKSAKGLVINHNISHSFKVSIISYVILGWSIFFHDAVYDPKSNRNEKESMIMFKTFWKDQEAHIPNDMYNQATGLFLEKMISTLIHATEKHQVIQQQIDDQGKAKNPLIPGEMSEGEIIFALFQAENEKDFVERFSVELQKVFLDIDMAVLGKVSKDSVKIDQNCADKETNELESRDPYMNYAGLIRDEYSYVPKEVYCEKRSEILSNFLEQRPRIYLNEGFHYLLESTARNNLKNEISLLRAGAIPGH